MSKTYDKIRELQLFIYISGSISTLPFTFKIIKIENQLKNALYIEICMIILTCLFCAFIIYCLSKKIRYRTRIRQRTLMILARQRAENNTGENESSGSSEVNEEELKEQNKTKINILLKTELSPKKFRKEYGLKDGNTCTICIENFKENKSKVSITPCKHVFHYKCLMNWLIGNVLNPKCPNCNYNLLEEFDKKNILETQNIDVIRKNTENQNLRMNNNNGQNNNINAIGDTLITRNARRNRSRMTTHIAQSTDHNIAITDGVNSNEVQEEEIVIENI
jgi:hypothetical protein